MATNGRATLMEVQSPEYSSGYFFRLPISDDQSETFGYIWMYAQISRLFGAEWQQQALGSHKVLR